MSYFSWDLNTSAFLVHIVINIARPMFLQESFYFEETFAIKYENEEVPDIVFRSVMNIVQPLESKRFFQPGSCCSMGMRVR